MTLTLEPSTVQPMRRIGDALQEIVDGNPILQFGMRNRLLNLSQVAEFILPLVAARVKKEVQVSAITMALSRLQRKQTDKPGKLKSGTFTVDSLAIHAGLAIVTYPNTQRLRQVVNTFINRLQKRNLYITVTEGEHQLTVLLDKREASELKTAVGEKPLHEMDKVAALAVYFQADYARTPGFFFHLFQKLYLQNLNIIELASTTNELVMYLAESDVELAFDTLYRQFVRR